MTISKLVNLTKGKIAFYKKILTAVLLMFFTCGAWKKRCIVSQKIEQMKALVI